MTTVLRGNGSAGVDTPSRRTGHHVPREIILWRRLRHGMSEDEVRTLLGAPFVVTGGAVEDEVLWRYDRSVSLMNLTLIFRRGLLIRWTEPDPDLYLRSSPAGPSPAVA